MKTALSTLLPCILIGLALAGCNKLTVENYDRLKSGMSYDEVTQILGKPDQCSDVIGIRNCMWGDEQRHVNVSFVGDKVMVYAAEGLR